MKQNERLTTNAPTGKTPASLEETQAHTNDAIREGQEDSSILHDEVDDKSGLEGQHNRDIRSASQEEYIQNDNNTLKEKE